MLYGPPVVALNTCSERTNKESIIISCNYIFQGLKPPMSTDRRGSFQGMCDSAVSIHTRNESHEVEETL